MPVRAPAATQSYCVADLPGWYSGERYAEDGNTVWVPAFHKTWSFPRGESVAAMREVVGECTRGQARAMVSSEHGEPFTDYRVRKVWMERRQATDEDEFEYGWTGDMVWECPKDSEGAMPYWRVDWVRPKPRSAA